MPLRGHKGRADELAEGVWHAPIDEPEGIQLAALDQLTGQVQRLRVGPGQVLHLHQPPGPPPGPVRPVELEQAPDPAVLADGGLNGVILLGGCLAQLLPDFQHPAHLGAVIVTAQQAGHRVLSQIGQLLTNLLLEPGGELCHAVGVGQAGELHGLRHEGLAHGVPQREGPGDQLQVHGHAPGVDDEVRFPLLLHPIRNGESGQPLFNLHLGDHILLAVFFEKLPFGGVVLGQVAAPLAVGLGGLAGDAEITDEGLAGVELLFVLGEPQSLACGVQARRVATVEAMEHGAAPLAGWQGAQIL